MNDDDECWIYINEDGWMNVVEEEWINVVGRVDL